MAFSLMKWDWGKPSRLSHFLDISSNSRLLKDLFSLSRPNPQFPTGWESSSFYFFHFLHFLHFLQFFHFLRFFHWFFLNYPFSSKISRKWLPETRSFFLSGIQEEKPETLEKIRKKAFEVIITTYEGAKNNYAVLRKILWEYFVIDEGHKIKNEESLISKVFVWKLIFFWKIDRL